MQHPGMNIKAVARLTGLSPHTIRAWERRYQAVQPQRSGGGQRLYQPEDVERLRLMRELVSFGHTISAIAHLSRESLHTLVGQARTSPLDHEPSSGGSSNAGKHPSIPVSTEADMHVTQQILQMLRQNQHDDIERELGWLRQRMGAETFIFTVARPLLAELGERVQRNELSIAQEHMLSAVLRSHLLALLQQSERHSDATRPKILFTTPEGEFHEFGILMAAILLSLLRHPVCYLGTSLPTSEVARMAQEAGVQVVVIGGTIAPDQSLVTSFDAYITELDQILAPAVALWLGGPRVARIKLKSHRDLKLLPSLEGLLSLDTK